MIPPAGIFQRMKRNDFPTEQHVRNYFVILKGFFGTHRAAAEYLGISYSRYNDWRWGTSTVPNKFRRLLQLAVTQIQNTPEPKQEAS